MPKIEKVLFCTVHKVVMCWKGIYEDWITAESESRYCYKLHCFEYSERNRPSIEPLNQDVQ